MEFVKEPSAEALRAWQQRMGFTYDTAAEALGMVRSAYGRMRAGSKPGRTVTLVTPVDRRTALACVAIEAGLSPFNLAPVTKSTKQNRSELPPGASK